MRRRAGVRREPRASTSSPRHRQSQSPNRREAVLHSWSVRGDVLDQGGADESGAHAVPRRWAVAALRTPNRRGLSGLRIFAGGSSATRPLGSAWQCLCTGHSSHIGISGLQRLKPSSIAPSALFHLAAPHAGPAHRPAPRAASLAPGPPQPPSTAKSRVSTCALGSHGLPTPPEAGADRWRLPGADRQIHTTNLILRDPER